MNPNFKKYLLKQTKSSDCEEIEVIQSLWSGYGNIVRYKLIDSKYDTVVVKNISLEKATDHPRGWNTDVSHNRKVKSYQVETNWYKEWSKECNDDCRIPSFLGSFLEGENQWVIIEDLDEYFPLRKYQLELTEVKACLKWLANFHNKFLNIEPNGLWKIGTYWHLETRPDEFEKIEHKELKANAHLIDEILNNCKYKTIVHGDAKLANFCFSEDGKQVAAVDFQYVGGGCGMKDVAYFLSSCLSGSECELYEEMLLDYYFQALRNALSVNDEMYFELEKEWRKMYPVACVDFTRFMLGWMPSHQKVNKYSLDKVKMVLSELKNKI